MFKKMFLVFLVAALLIGASPFLQTAEAVENDYITYAQYNQTGLPLSQDAYNPTEIWENDILEFGFATEKDKDRATFSLSIEYAYNEGSADAGYEYLPFDIGHGAKRSAFVQLVMGDTNKYMEPNRGFPRSAIGKTITLTVKVNETTENYYIRAKSIQRWLDPLQDQDKVQDAYVLQNGESVPLSQKQSQPTEITATDDIVFAVSSSLVSSTLAITAALPGAEFYGEYLHLKVEQDGIVQFNINQLDVDITSNKTITILWAKQISGSLNIESSYAPHDFDLFYVKVVKEKPALPSAKPTVQTNTVAANGEYSMAIKADSSLWAWGRNEYGQLGDGTTIDKSHPVKIMDDVIFVAADDNYSLAIKKDGSLWTWGNNEYGQLGDGSNINRLSPIKVMDNVVSAAIGGTHTAAVTSDGSLWTWGFNDYGQLGNGTTKDSYVPVKVMSNVASVIVSRCNTAAIKTDSSLWAWGWHNGGILPGDSTVFSMAPEKVMDNVLSVTLINGSVYAIRIDGSLWVWGHNYFGQLGDATTISRSTPVKIMDEVVAISGNNDHAMALKKDGSLWAWGCNRYGQLGDGTTTTYDKDGFIVDNHDRLQPTKIMDNVTSVAAENTHGIAVRTDGSLWAWGNNWSGQLGDGTFTTLDNDWNVIINNDKSKPVKVMEDVAIIDEGNFAVKKDGSLWAWGFNRNGQLGDGTTTNHATPVKIMDGVKLPGSVMIIPEPSTPPPPVTPKGFSDVPTSHWAYSAIMQLAEKGVISGYADGSFKPNGLVSRSEFAKMMTLALQIPLLSNPTPSFADIGVGDWELVYVETAKKYLTGYQQGNSYYFKGSEPAMREDMAVALVKALGLETEVADDANAEYVNARLQQIFSDAETISPNLRRYVLVAYEFDLISGYPDGTFGPQRSITRAETAALLVKVLKLEAMQKVTFD